MAKNKKNYRLFFAIELEPLQKTQLLMIQNTVSEFFNAANLTTSNLSKSNPTKSANSVSPDNFHITLSYLGNTTESQLEDILNHFQDFSLAPFEVSAERLMVWPKPAVLALSINDAEKKLHQCKKEIEKRLSQLKLFSYSKKPFEPHITLFRQVDSVIDERLLFERVENQLKQNGITIKVNEISLIVSTNNQQGVFYQTLEVWSLGNLSVKQQLLGK